MKRFQQLLAAHRALTFVVVTFVITWLYEFAIVYPLVTGNLLASRSLEATTAIALAMFFPAIGVVITRLITGDGFKNCVIKPYRLRKSLPWFLVAWFGPSILIVVGVIVYFLIFPNDFDPEGLQFQSYLYAQLEDAGISGEMPLDIPMLVAIQMTVGVLVGPLLNGITSLGEEWGWRGYLVPKLGHRLSIVPTLLLSGIIWGLWHAPITALGHNYGLGYPGWPFTGILAMCWFCTIVGVFLSYVTIRTGSSLAAAFGHGALNAVGGAATIFATSNVSPFIGPAPTGIIGGIGFLVVAIIMLVDLRRREKAGTLVIPQAGRVQNQLKN